VTDTPRNKLPLLEKIIEAAGASACRSIPTEGGKPRKASACLRSRLRRQAQSTAVCYLDPVRGGRTLVIEQGAMAEALILEGKRCVGVLCRERRFPAGAGDARSDRRGGSINSPKLLELSGIGQGELLRARGIAGARTAWCRRESARSLFAADKFAIKERNLTSTTMRGAGDWRARR